MLIPNVSNIISGENPPFTKDEFYEMYPQFGLNTETNKYNVPQSVVDMYINMANGCIKEKRWHSQWKIGMCLYIAHFCALYLRQLASPTDDLTAIGESSKMQGVESSMSADGISVSMDYSTTTNLFKAAGSFNLTSYGQQLLTMAKLVGKGFMYVY